MLRTMIVSAYLLTGALVVLATVWADHRHGHRLLSAPRRSDYLLVLCPALIILWPALLLVARDALAPRT